METDATATERRMIMTEFITRNYGNKEFEVIIKTDSEEHYKETQDFARKLIDHAKPQTNADRIRSMSDEELNELFNGIYNAGEEDAVAYEWGQRTNSFEWTMEWLQQPAKENDEEDK